MLSPRGGACPPTITHPPCGRDLPLVVHVPYASRALPAAVQLAYLEQGARLSAAIERATDDLLDHVCGFVPYLGATLVVNAVSPLLLRAGMDPADSHDAPTAAGPLVDDVTNLCLPPGIQCAALREICLGELRAVVSAAVERFERCVLLEMRTFEPTPQGADGGRDPRVLRLGAVEGNDLEWLLAPLREAGAESAVEGFTLSQDEPASAAAVMRAEFGPVLDFVRIELGRHTYLDLEDGRCYAPWLQGLGFLHYQFTVLANLVDERFHYPRQALSREQALAYVKVWRQLDGGLPPVRRVVAWDELENKPRLAGVKARDIGDCWIALYEPSLDISPGVHPFEVFHRVTGAHEFLGVRYDEP